MVRAKLEQDKKNAILARMPKNTAAALGGVGPQKVEEYHVATENIAAEPAYEPSDFSARVNVHRAEIERLEAELSSAEGGYTQLSAGAIHGLKRQLQSHRAVLLREKRHAERRTSAAAEADAEAVAEAAASEGAQGRDNTAADAEAHERVAPPGDTYAMASSASTPAFAAAPDDEAPPANLDVYRRAMGYGAVTRSPRADDVPDPKRLSHLKAASRTRRQRPRDIYAAAAASALDASAGGRHQERPAWQDVVQPSAGRQDDEDENQYFLGLSAQYPPSQQPLPASPQAMKPQFSSPPLAPAERHYYGKRQNTQYLGAAAAPFSNELTYNRSPEY
jgi:hypothetical protein